MKASIIGALAPLFNSLLGIEPTHFGRATRASEPGAGTQRRAIREKKFRADQAERLKDAAPQKITRQQLRRLAMGRAH